jgi:hypothetical protein
MFKMNDEPSPSAAYSQRKTARTWVRAVIPFTLEPLYYTS